jgi:hypothetical protein
MRSPLNHSTVILALPTSGTGDLAETYGGFSTVILALPYLKGDLTAMDFRSTVILAP